MKNLYFLLLFMPIFSIGQESEWCKQPTVTITSHPNKSSSATFLNCDLVEGDTVFFVVKKTEPNCSFQINHLYGPKPGSIVQTSPTSFYALNYGYYRILYSTDGLSEVRILIRIDSAITTGISQDKVGTPLQIGYSKTTKTITIYSPNTSMKYISIYSLMGVNVTNWETLGPEFEINIHTESYIAGVYIIKVRLVDGTIVYRKIIIND